MDQATRNELKTIATRWNIDYSTVETVSKMAMARLRREGLDATPENVSQALKQANQDSLEMSQMMLDNPHASARMIREHMEANEVLKSPNQ